MSIDAYRWTYRQHPKRVEDGEVTDKKHPAAKLVLITLADFVRKGESHCWPSQSLLAELTDMHERQVRRCLADLETQGLVRRESRRRKDGSRRSDRLVLAMSADDVGAAQDADVEPDEEPDDQPDERAGRTAEPTGREMPDQPDERAGHEPTTENRLQDSSCFANAQQEGTDEPSAAEFVAQLDERLTDSTVPLTSSRKARYGREFKEALQKGRSPDELDEAVDRICERWHEAQLSVEQAMRDCQNGKQTNGSPPNKPQAGTRTTPEQASQAIAEHDHLRRYAYLCDKWDFTADEEPPYPVYKALGGTPDEQHSNLIRMQSVTRRAMREIIHVA